MGVSDRLYIEFVNSCGISTDTRSLKPGEMFIALSGENYDGNAFAQSAIDKGASCVVVSDPEIVGLNVVHVQDTLLALQELASVHRGILKIPIIAITGSNGKTTTKELLSKVLATKFVTTATKGNLNNHIGVPLSLLSISKKSEMAIIEIGANHIGEVRSLCDLTRPTHGLVTNIGKAHLEGFGSLEGVKTAKSELYESLASSNGVAFVNMTADYLGDLSINVAQKVKYAIEGGAHDSAVDYRFSQEPSKNGVCVGWNTPDGEKFVFESALFGSFNVPNIATAVTVGLHFGVGPADIKIAIESYRPSNNRSQIVKKEGKTIFLDAYNANPVSMELAIAEIARRNGKKSLILGGMNELGTHETEEHLKLLEIVDQFEWKEVLLVGIQFSSLHQSFGFHWFHTVEECQEHLQKNVLAGDIVLIKGSRSFHLESLLDYIK